MHNPPASHLLAPGKNCWRIEEAHRAKLLIDGAAYFAALRQVMAAARNSIFIIGWDIDSRIPLHPESHDDGLPLALGEFLDALATRCSTLQVYVLNWDFAMLYALDREFLPIYSLGWRTHRRLRFHLDDRHPPGGSHHQKMVVADDAIAFVGGIDLSKSRWDTPEHEPGNPRRRNADGELYPPFHDVQMMIEGPAAAAIGALARERWRRATGEAPVEIPGTARRGLWPKAREPDFESVGIGIARTEPSYDGREPVHEVRQLFLGCIETARRSIYIENQYFTSTVIAEAMTRRLREPDGPEIVVVSRLRGSGWLEENTMFVLRARLIRRLRGTTGADRLRFYCPHQAGLGDECIALHSKLMVVDDRVLRVGSANISNRSLGVDSECDLLIEAASPDRLIDDIVTRDERPRAGKRIVLITVALLFFAALAAGWRWGPLREWITPAAFEVLADAIRDAPATPLWVLLAYVVASLLAVPITLVVVATALAFGPWAAVGYALAGSVLGASVTFALGRLLGRTTVRRLAGSRLNALSRRLGRGGIAAVLVFRILPVAPFTIVNLVAGASHLQLRDFLVGTALGMAPGIVAVCVFTDRLAAALSDPSPWQITVLVIVLLSIALGAAGIHRWLARRDRSARERDAEAA